MVWKFFEIRKSYGNQLWEGPNSVRFYLNSEKYGMYGLNTTKCRQNQCLDKTKKNSDLYNTLAFVLDW